MYRNVTGQTVGWDRSSSLRPGGTTEEEFGANSQRLNGAFPEEGARKEPGSMKKLGEGQMHVL